MIVINLGNSTRLSRRFRTAVRKTFLSIFTFTITPLNLVIVTDDRSVRPVATFLSELVAEQVATRILLAPGWRWRRQLRLPELAFSFVDSRDIVRCRPDFVRELKESTEQAKDHKSVEQDPYTATLFYIAPIYHLAFTGLKELIVIDATDLEFHDSVAALQEQMTEVRDPAVIALGLDLSPNYYYYLTPYRRNHPGSRLGTAGPAQGFNTGVVLYRLAAMRASKLYNKQLNPASLLVLQQEFGYGFTLAEQDWFTSLGFRHPHLFHVLPCRFNRQTSIQFLRPPFEQNFESFHACGKKTDVVVFHGNGCGPRPQDCSFFPANSTTEYWRTHERYMEDIHLEMEVFWKGLAGV
jgi:hypothetical protein